MRKFKITEEQYNRALDEGITLTADVPAAGGDVNRAVEKTKEDAKNAGVDLDKAKIEMPANTESASHKGKPIREGNEPIDKTSSELFTLKEFLK